MRKRKLLSLIMAMAMVLSLLPATVWAENGESVAIGNNKYASLAEALEKASSGDTITLLENISSSDAIMITKSITIDGGTAQYSIDFSASRGIRIAASDVTVNLKNLNVCSSDNKMERALQVDNNYTNVNLTVDNCKLSSTHYAVNLTTGSEGTLTATNSTITGWATLNCWSDHYIATFERCTLKGINDKGYNEDGWNDFGTIVLEGDTTDQTQEGAFSSKVYLKNSTIEATQTTGNEQHALLFNTHSSGNTVSLENCTITLGTGCNFLIDNGGFMSLTNKTIVDESTLNSLSLEDTGLKAVSQDDGTYQIIDTSKNVWYYWDTDDNQYEGAKASLQEVLTSINGNSLTAGEYIDLFMDVTLSNDVTVNMPGGLGTFTLNLKGYTISGGKIHLPSGCTVICDTQVDDLFEGAVARVGSTYYTSLADAVSQSSKGAVIELLENATLSNTLTISKALTINGNNKTITCGSDIATSALLDVTASNVSIHNLTVNTDNKVRHGVQFYCVDGGELSGVTVNGGSYTAVIINGARNITLQDCNLNSNGYTNIEYAMGVGVISANQIPSFIVNNVTFKPADDNGSPVMIWADNSTVSNLKTALGNSATDEAVLDKIQESIVKQDNSELIAYVYLGMADETTPNIQTISIGQKRYTVTISGGGTGATATGGQYAMGATVSINAGTRSGYIFNGWTSSDVTISNAGQTEASFTMPGKDVTVIANWTYNGGSSGGSSSSGDKTETVTNPDGSTTTTVTKPDGTVTETTKNPDGSKEVVETKKDGTVTTTTTDKTGNKTETVEKTDGSSTTTVDNKDGSSSTTSVSKDGQVEAEVKLPAAVVNEAADKGETVTLPMPQVPVTSDKDSAPTVTVDLPANTTAKVEIPVEDVTYGTVAIRVKADGTEEIIKTTLTTENGVAVTLADGETVKIVDNAKDFVDVPDAYWGSAFVDFVTSRGLFSGTSATTFSPDLPMTRAMIVTVLAAYDGADTTAAVGDHWYSAGQQWAMENGVSDGTNMEGTLTREQLAVMLWSYAGRPQASGSLSRYDDAGSVSFWAEDAMIWAVENGLISGSDSGDLLPQGQATRVQVATILMRFVETLHG